MRSRLRTVFELSQYVATGGRAEGRRNPARRPHPQPSGLNVSNAVSRSVLHASPSHSSTLQLIMIE